MKSVREFGIFVLFCAVLTIVSSAPVKDPEDKQTKRHDLNNDKELLLRRLKEFENELQGRRSSEVLDKSNPDSVPRKEEEEVKGESVRDKNVLSSLLRTRGSNRKAAQDTDDLYKQTLKRLLDQEFESGRFEDQPFTDNELGQIPDHEERGRVIKSDEHEERGRVIKSDVERNDKKAASDTISVSDLKLLLSILRQDKQEATDDNADEDRDVGDEDGDIAEEEEDDKVEDGDEKDESEEDESDDFLQGISVDDLKKLINEINQKKQDGQALTQENMGKVVEYLVSHLSINDLQIMLTALRDGDEDDEEEMTDEELEVAIEGLVSGTSIDDLQKILAAIRLRKQDSSSEESNEASTTEQPAVNDRDLAPHQTEEEVMEGLMDFLSALSVEDLEKTILAVRRKKLEMKQAAEKIAGEYTEDDDADGENKDAEDQTEEVKEETDNDMGDGLGPCAQEKEDFLDLIEAARLAGKQHVGGQMPNCDEDGYYAPKQCSGSMCYCVDIHGTATEGEAMIWEAATLKCTQEEADEPTDGNGDDEDANEEAKLEQAERELLELLKDQKRHQQAKSRELNM